MVPSVRAWIDRHRIARFLAITYAFTWAIQGLLAVSGMSASWTLSILIDFGGFGPPTCTAVIVVLAFRTERLSNHDVSDTSALGLDRSESRATSPEEMGGIGLERQG